MSISGDANEAQFLFEVSGTEFAVADFTAREGISTPYEVDLTLASEDEISFDDVVGNEAVLTILGGDDKQVIKRYFHGIISQFMQTGIRGRFYLYQANMVPTLWLLSLEQDCRIFQEKSVTDIVKKILEERGITGDRLSFRLQGQYQPREYCVQYRETDLNFISRLLEEEGIFYFLEHTKDKHVLVFGDGTVSYQPIQGKADVQFNPSDGLVPKEEFVSNFVLSRQIRTGKVTLKDFNFERPSLNLTVQEQGDSFQNLEEYDYPGEYKKTARGKKLAKVRLQEAVQFKDKAEGQSVCSRFSPGFTFNLTEHEQKSFNQEYVFAEVVHAGAQPQALEEFASAGGAFSYSNHFLGVPSSVTLRPDRNSPKPVVEGVQTAIVVGPKGKEIYTDEYGRVKVQFHWDREGKNDEKSSCWIRVSQLWAGAGWGAMYIPRIGHEVIVDFLEGDPDRPIVTGRVYHANNPPPYTPSEEETKSTIKSESSPGGGGFNEIRFEDKKGSEEIFIHAQKDQNEIIENDRNATIKGGNDALTVESGTRSVTVKGDTSLIVQAGNRSVGVTGGSYSAESDTTLNLKAPQINATGTSGVNIGSGSINIYGSRIQLSVGGNTITIDESGVVIIGTLIQLNPEG
ncbi:MAG: type VI secretion system tip protein VgrG [Deltaproteobacteria bacterium]|nr:MAG: type VI secretion system tip protein VgrG [Deltaproteobacteria bacterium]